MESPVKITPPKGMYLTQVAEVPDNERTYASDWIALGSNDNASNYREADQAEYEAWQKRVEEAEKEEMAKLKQETIE